ncbi:lipoprotein [Micromonospora sp. RTGN7]|uniref:lipoprotein n=1 Tax=Micromonospora sp. RTGN7 TaxID=3016526 RepID=UPI0029FF3858|nr:lipoprotein [Micromonospora sp. RTGN7]
MFRRVAVLAVLAVLTLTATVGCADTATPVSPSPLPSASLTASPVAAGAPWYDEVTPATAGTTVGPEGTACPLSMTFSVPPKWKVKAVKAGTDYRAGPALLLCEIDAKPAGNIGFLRIWQIEGARPLNPQVTVDKFLAEYGSKAEDQQYRRTKAGSLDSFEAAWTEDGTRKRAIMVSTLYGQLMLTLGGLDNEEFEEMFPAYQLAKSSVSLPK